jgi:hypothetical protein
MDETTFRALLLLLSLERRERNNITLPILQQNNQGVPCKDSSLVPILSKPKLQYPTNY